MNDRLKIKHCRLLLLLNAAFLLPTPAPAQSVSTNTTFVVNSTNNALPPNETNFFTQNYPLLTNALVTGGFSSGGGGGGSGTVTSVSAAGDGTIFPAGSFGTVTGSGTLTLPAPKNQSANTLFAGPASGSATTPLFRLLAYSDLPGAVLTNSAPALVTLTNLSAGSIVDAGNGITLGGTYASAFYGFYENAGAGVIGMTNAAWSYGLGMAPNYYGPQIVGKGVFWNYGNFTVIGQFAVSNQTAWIHGPGSGTQEILHIDEPPNQLIDSIFAAHGTNGLYDNGVVIDTGGQGGIEAEFYYFGYTNVSGTYNATKFDRTIYANAASGNSSVVLPAFDTNASDIIGTNTTWNFIRDGFTNGPAYYSTAVTIYRSDAAASHSVNVYAADHAKMLNLAGQPTNLLLPAGCAVSLIGDGTNLYAQQLGTNWPVSAANLTGLNSGQFAMVGGVVSVPSGALQTNGQFQGVVNGPGYGAVNATAYTGGNLFSGAVQIATPPYLLANGFTVTSNGSIGTYGSISTDDRALYSDGNGNLTATSFTGAAPNLTGILFSNVVLSGVSNALTLSGTNATIPWQQGGAIYEVVTTNLCISNITGLSSGYNRMTVYLQPTNSFTLSWMPNINPLGLATTNSMVATNCSGWYVMAITCLGTNWKTNTCTYALAAPNR